MDRRTLVLLGLAAILASLVVVLDLPTPPWVRHTVYSIGVAVAAYDYRDRRWGGVAVTAGVTGAILLALSGLGYTPDGFPVWWLGFGSFVLAGGLYVLFALIAGDEMADPEIAEK